jgi:hypothetical protein
MKTTWKTFPAVHYLNQDSRTWTTITLKSQAAAATYYSQLLRQHVTARLVYGTVEYKERTQ